MSTQMKQRIRRRISVEYPYSRDIVESGYLGLADSDQRQGLYVRTNNDRYVFENPLFVQSSKHKRESMVNHNGASHGLQMRAKDFLASIPSFSDFSDLQLTVLEQKATIKQYNAGDIVFRQAEEGDMFYVINQGAADVLIQENKVLLSRNDFGKIVNRLTEGCYFGERALMTSERRAATIRVVSHTVCLAFSRTVYEEIISGSNALIGKDTNDNVDWSKDHETRSLFKHIENILEIGKIDASPKVKRVLYELSTAFTPELSADEVISRMVMRVKNALKVDRVGLFVLSEDKRSMVLKVSERSKGIRLPVRGLAGAIVQANTAINIADAYQDPRFDATMDRRTGYRTRQLLGVPLRHPISGEAIGLLQVNNRLDGGAADSFTAEQQKVLELAAVQLSELLHGRADVFIHAGGASGNQKAFGQGVGDGLVLLNSAEVLNPFSIELSSLSLGNLLLFMENYQSHGASPGESVTQKEGSSALVHSFNSLELLVSLHLSLNQLCAPRLIRLELPSSVYAQSGFGEVKRSSSSSSSHSHLHPSQQTTLQISERLLFDIAVKDLPRATRVLFRVYGSKKRISGTSISHAKVGSSSVPLGWTAAALYDFKGCVDSVLPDLRFFKSVWNGGLSGGGSLAVVDVPINTTLTNAKDPLSGALSVVLVPDLILSHDSSTPRVRIVHSMPTRSEPINGQKNVSGNERNRSDSDFSNSGSGIGSGDDLSAAHIRELDRIIMLSFNPMSASIMTDADKDFLWDLRYSLLPMSQLLPAFVMSVRWHKSEQVQELYDLLDLWEPPSSEQALMLLDRRFMDPKVRAYAAQSLEELPDEKLKLYMLQLCQQLKFENHVDSALSRFLLRRALTNQRLIGHIYFWLLQSEVYNEDVSKRFIILLQIYIRHCGAHRIELGHQMFVMKRLEKVAEAVILGESREARKQILKDRLKEIVLPSVFKLPLNPHLKVCGINVEKCRVMESKKKPLMLYLIDVNGNEVVLMLKVGDDLRQDALIMQLLRVMNELWKSEGLEMEMKLYDCISTGHERGLLHVVTKATTLGNILLESTDKSKKSGNSKSGSLTRKISSALKALGDFTVFSEWIKDKVDEDIQDESLRAPEMEKRVQSFMISTAAYCVASYVLGLGDRHNDNLMITRQGHFFHIDFGHILGNFKSKMGVKRERAPFVFTPAMKAVMSPAQYDNFVDLCCDVYNILREHAMLLVSLFSLAIPCNLPELQEEKDVVWIYEKLLVGASHEEASEHFKKQLEISLNTRGTRLNDATHMLAHA